MLLEIVEGVLRGLTAFIYVYWIYIQICDTEALNPLSEGIYHFRLKTSCKDAKRY